MYYEQTCAFRVAVAAHDGQTRREGGPYVLHSIRVLQKVLAWVPEAARAGTPWAEVALLHDVVEDTHVTEADLREQFDAATVNAVMELTDDQTSPKGERKRAQLRKAPHYSKVARWVKMADMFDNLSSRLRNPDMFDAKSNAMYFAWKYAIFRALVPTADDRELANALRTFVFDVAKQRGILDEANTAPGALESYFAAEDAKK